MSILKYEDIICSESFFVLRVFFTVSSGFLGSRVLSVSTVMEVPFFVVSTGCREVRTGIRSKRRVRGKRRNRKVRRAVAFEDRLKWKKMRKIIELFDDYLL